MASLGDATIQLNEVMQFSTTYFAQGFERITGTHAFQLLINRDSGWAYPDRSLDMAWNTKDGMREGMVRWQGFGASADHVGQTMGVMRFGFRPVRQGSHYGYLKQAAGEALRSTALPLAIARRDAGAVPSPRAI